MPDLKVCIVDDEPFARERVRRLLEEEGGYEILSECADGQSAIEAIQQERPDIVFLDIQMRGLDGFAVIEALGEDLPKAVIFVTAYDQYAVKAFDSCALDYLLKPFDRDRFRKALRRADERIRESKSGGLDHRLHDLVQQLRRQIPSNDRLAVRSSGRVQFLKPSEILWVEASGKHVRIHTEEECHTFRESMSRLEERLDPSMFVRIHRSSIVNLEHIKELKPLAYGEYEVRLDDETRLVMSRSYRQRLNDAIDREL